MLHGSRGSDLKGQVLVLREVLAPLYTYATMAASIITMVSHYRMLDALDVLASWRVLVLLSSYCVHAVDCTLTGCVDS